MFCLVSGYSFGGVEFMIFDIEFPVPDVIHHFDDHGHCNHVEMRGIINPIAPDHAV